MSRPNYILEDNPVYTDQIQKLLPDDPVLADDGSFFQGLIGRILNNEKAIKQLVDILQESSLEKFTNLEQQAQTHINRKDNPHGATALQVGLGNVPNVTTNDQTPTYTAASTVQGLASGEKLSVAFGKLGKAVADYIQHKASQIIHITAVERAEWNAKADKTYVDTEMLNKANLEDYTYYKLSGGNFAESGADLNTFPLGIIWAYSGAESSTLLHRPPNANPTATEIITESGNGYTASVISQTWKQRVPVREWRRTSVNGVWTDWVEYSTATPPVEYNLPLAAGITSLVDAKYCKTQEGIVFLTGWVQGAAKNKIVATLPAGYRPRRMHQIVAPQSTDTNTNDTTRLEIATSGEIKVIAVSNATRIGNGLSLCLSFPASI